MTSIKAIAASSAVPASAKGRDMPAERHYGDDTEFGPESTQGRLERHESEIALSARQGSATDSLTLLISKGPRLAKLWRADGAIESYQDAKYFSVEVKPVNSLRDVEIVLSKYEANPRCAVIRGIPASGVDLEHTRRLGELFPDQPHRWLALDVDEYDTGAERWFEDPVPHIEQFIRAALPPGFQDVSYIWALSGSAGHSKSPTKLKLRLWFWLDRAVDGATLKVWRDALDARPNAPKKAIDGAIFHPVQLTFIAAPVLEPGAECPIVQRRGFVEGALGDEALTTSFENLPTQQKRVRGRTEMRDPREIPGIVGAFNRLVTIEEAVEVHLAGEFEASPNDNSRYTWLRSSSGAPEGAFITSDGLRFCNTHGSAPESAVALNAWDLVRVYHFGDRDSVQESALPPTQRPSHKAMVDWAYKNIEGLREEMRAARPSAADEFDDCEDDSDEQSGAVMRRLQRDRQAHALDVDAREREVQEAIDEIKRVEVATELEHRLAPALRVRDWTDAERERLVTAIRGRYRVLTDANLPVATARDWLEPDDDGSAPRFPDVNADRRVLGTLGNVEALLQRHGIVVRYNVIKKEDEILIPGRGFSCDNNANVSFAELLSICNRVDMKIQPSTLRAFVTVIADRNQYNPALSWIESRPWDGRDRLQDWYDTVSSPKKELKEMLMRRWAIQCIAVLHNNGEVQARGVLTFQGAQYQGKTRWLRSLAPAGLNLVNTGQVLDVHNKDHVKIAISFWLTELGELDATFKKSDLAALKSFISQTVDTFRRPYAASESSYPRRTSLFASVNDPEFLRDSTGNTRYWVVPADAVRADHSIDVQQLWAQVLALYRSGEQGWLTESEMAILNESNLDFTAADPIEEMLVTNFQWDAPIERWRWLTATDIARRLGFTLPRKPDVDAVGRAVRKLNDGKHRRSSHARELLVPPSRDPLAGGQHDDDD